MLAARPDEPKRPVQDLQIAQTKGACAEGDSLGPADSVIQEERKAFWEQQMRMNAASAEPSAYLSACHYLGLDPKHPSTTPAGRPIRFEFRPHQVQGLAFLLRVIQTLLRAAVLADEMGLGKTTTASFPQERLPFL